MNSIKEAARKGDWELVNKLLSEGASPIWGLVGAIKGRHDHDYDSIEMLINKCNNIDNTYWNWAMEAAAKNGNMRLVKRFIKLGADNWDWGLCGAVKSGCDDIIKFFLDLDADVEQGLFAAAKTGNMRLVKYFVELGAKHFSFALANASLKGHFEIVKFLTEKLAKNINEDWGWPLGCAVGAGHHEIVNYLLDVGVFDEDDYDDALSEAVKIADKYLIDQLISKGASDWNKALRIAASGNHRDLVSFFLEKQPEDFEWISQVIERDPENKEELIAVCARYIDSDSEDEQEFPASWITERNEDNIERLYRLIDIYNKERENWLKAGATETQWVALTGDYIDNCHVVFSQTREDAQKIADALPGVVLIRCMTHVKYVGRC